MKILGSLVIVLAIGWWAGTHWFEPGWRYDVLGVDVSHHQGSIDWPTLAQDRVVFAYIKATEGGDFQDPRFAENGCCGSTIPAAVMVSLGWSIATPSVERASNSKRYSMGPDSMGPYSVATSWAISVTISDGRLPSVSICSNSA